MLGMMFTSHPPSAAIVKLLPALSMSDSICENSVLGTLDIGDAFLQVPQLVPRVVRLGSVDLCDLALFGRST